MEGSIAGLGRGIRLATLAACLTVPAAFGQYDCWPDMSQLVPENIFVDTLLRTPAQLNEPLKMDFAPNPDGSADLYWIERAGKMRRLRPGGAPETLGTIPVFTRQEMGLLGIALAPGFPADPRVFLFHTPEERVARLSSYAVGPEGLIPGSEKRILSIPISSDHWTGGALLFDPQGNLYVAVGSGIAGPNAGKPWNPADTKDLRGKILRIRPDAQGGYTIPEGNLYGPGGLPDPEDKARKEIWAMGVKNPYTMSWDSRRGALAWADMGPDGQLDRPDEYNFSKQPGFFGFPIWVGPQTPLVAGQDTAAPVNTRADNLGMQALPPARGATWAVRQGAPIIGAVYWPKGSGRYYWPHGMENLWFFTDFNRGEIETMRIGDDGRLSDWKHFLPSLRLRGPLEMRFGPDGGLYVIEYAGWLSSTANTSILRIRFRSKCFTAVKPRAARKPAWKRGHRGWDAAGRILGETAGR